MKRALPLTAMVIALGAAHSAKADEPPAERSWSSCVEHVPPGATRPELVESFPSRGISGYASNLEVTVKHGKGETVLPEGFKVQGGSDASRALGTAGFVIPDPAGGVSPSVVIDKEGTSTKVTIPFMALPKEPGRHAMMLPPVPIAVGRASGELVTLCTKPHTILVEDPIANQADPKVKVNPPPRPQREEWVLAEEISVGVLLGVVMALFGVYLWRSYQKRPKPVPYVEPKLPWIAALEELAAIRRSTLLAEKRTDEYFDGVSDCVRKYLGARYGFDGLESTTDEVRALLKRVRPPVPELGDIVDFLADCDLVKFARLVPDEKDCTEALTQGEKIVRRTTPPARQPKPKSKRAPSAAEAS